MSAENPKFMWQMVLFDLPVGTREQRKIATRFRKFLINDGYMMMQFSVYARVCNGMERVDKHFKRLQKQIPSRGSVRVLQITDQQFERMKLLVGDPTPMEKQKTRQLVLF